MNKNLQITVDEALQAKLDSGDTGFKVGGVFSIEQVRDGEVIYSEVSPNIVVNAGLDYILDAALSAGTRPATFYLGIYKNNYTPQATNVMSTFTGAGVANEVVTEINEAARQAWVEAGVSARTITNSASPAVFTANGTVAVYGAFLTTDSTKGGTAGTLIAASKFATVRNLVATDVLNITYTLTIADA